MLAGRKLLLADDSTTIQKVVELTFADEDVTVVCVNNGREAIERLEEFQPDVVLADVFMPQLNGYEVCEYIKQNEKLKHIPVMLLVGSFEPFDEEEARRVGANDTLTKPFQSIRRLLDKVGLLVNNRPPEEQVPTAELPKPEGSPEPEAEKLTEAEIEITTADTQPLPPELRKVVEDAAASQAKKDGMRESTVVEPRREVSSRDEGDVLLDLGDYSRASSGPGEPDEEFVLDVDLDEVPEPSPVEAAFPASAFRNRDRYRSPAGAALVSSSVSQSAAMSGSEPPATKDQLATTQGFQRNLGETVNEPVSEGQVVEAPVGDDQASAQQLSSETIDAIARRVVEQISTKVVEEIAWEVVPQLAELLIRKQLEEKSS